jgi:hypothetical protein
MLRSTGKILEFEFRRLAVAGERMEASASPLASRLRALALAGRSASTRPETASQRSNGRSGS